MNIKFLVTISIIAGSINSAEPVIKKASMQTENAYNVFYENGTCERIVRSFNQNTYFHCKCDANGHFTHKNLTPAEGVPVFDRLKSHYEQYQNSKNK